MNVARRQVPWLVLLAELLCAPLVYFINKVTTDEPGCEGIGFGCNLSPHNNGVVVMWVYLFVLAVTAALIGLGELGGRRRPWQIAREVLLVLGTLVLLFIALSNPITAQ